MLKGRRWKVGLPTLMIVVMLIVAACGGDDDPTATTRPTATAPPQATATPRPTATPAGPQPKRGGTLNFWMTRDPSNMDINRQRSSANWMSILPQMNWLVENFNIRGEINPDLAESWSVSADGKVWTFNLVQNAKWHDGEQVNADDIIWTLNRIVNNIDGEVPSPPFKGPLGLITNMERPDDFTVVLTLKSVSASFIPFIGAIGNVIYPEHVAISEFEEKRPVGSGPFIWDEWIPADSVTFVRNDNYWKTDEAGRQLPYLDGIKIFIIADAALGLAAYRVGDIDITFPFASVLKGKTEQIKREVPGTKFGGGESWWYILFRSGVAPWDNPDLRRAVHLAIDRVAVNEALEEGEGSIYRYLSPANSKWGLSVEEIRGLPGYNPDTKAADIAEAKRLFSAAGVDPSKIELNVPVRNIYEAIGVVAIDQLSRSLGISVTIDISDDTNTVDRQNRGAFDVYFSRNSGFMDDPSANLDPFLRSTSGLNYGKWVDPEVDATLDAIDSELDTVKRKQLSQELERKMIDLAWYVVIGGNPTPIAWGAHVKNFDVGGAQDGPPWQFGAIWLER
ncbi:MAG: ABC transporter substrate-binding protein [Chloroflexi bacterium]|nr:ABC transporter substrate-binding protein [Chloroflexota bacterium]